MASYRFFAGRVHRQDLTGGDWTELTQEESNELLSTLGQQEEVAPVAWTEVRLREEAKRRGWYVRENASVPDIIGGGWKHPFSVTLSSREFLEFLASVQADAEEPFPQPKRKGGGEPCGECHIQPGETCDICGAAVPADAGEPTLFQSRVRPWMMACFGPEISADRVERGDRFLEEVFELLQSGGYDKDRILSLRDYVWGREIGEPAQEAGGVMVTLAAYCLAHGLDMHAAGETELARIWTKVEKIRAKQAAKPKHSPLPQVGSATPASKWRQEGKEDPHGKHYDCERAQLAMGDLTDDEMANAIFMADRSSLDLIAYQSAAKDRIRWLSRALEASLSNRHQAQRDEAKQAMMAADWIWRDEK